ncbi:MAG TPA: NAD(+)/NADH kinase [Gaiellaceae bacterium]|nr:NAD(+)/NADH kinase [Gaiellaceae bacterium]
MSASPQPSVRSAAVVTHGREGVGEALDRLRRVADEAGVELHVDDDATDVDAAIVLGGDGTMLRTLGRFLGTGVPVIGVNYGRVGFLTAIAGDQLEDGVRRVFGGDYRRIELSTVEVRVGDQRHVAVNDVVVAGGELGRMIELSYSIGGEELGVQPCDGLICATPAGSTAYNLSNGGPVLVWGIDAMVLTFVAPHALTIRPLVIPRAADVVVANQTADLEATVLVDGRRVGSLPHGEHATIHIAEQRSVLGTLPEVTFFRRYAATFGR